MYIEETGTPGAPTILFLHGAGIAGWMWQAQMDEFKDFHCLAPDLPGHGRSSMDEWISLADTADKLAEVIRTRATGNRANIVGLSLGGYIGLHLLARHSELLERAVLSGVTIAPLPNPKLTLLQFWLMSFLVKNSFLIKKNAQMMNLPDKYFETYAQSVRAMSRQAFWRVVREVTLFHTPEAVRNSSIPTLVVGGEREAELVKLAIPKLAAMMPCARGYLAPRVGHGWNGEVPDLFNRMLRAWFGNTPMPKELIVAQQFPK